MASSSTSTSTSASSTTYEAERLANIRKNHEKLAALQIHTLVNDLVTHHHHQSSSTPRSKRRKFDDTRILPVLRRSNRLASNANSHDVPGINAEIVHGDQLTSSSLSSSIPQTRKTGPIPFDESIVSYFWNDDQHQAQLECEKVIQEVQKSNTSFNNSSNSNTNIPTKTEWQTAKLSMKKGSEKSVQKRIMQMCYHPASNSEKSILACADRDGEIAIMMYTNNAEAEEAPINAARWRPHAGMTATDVRFASDGRLFSSSQYGDIRYMDIEAHAWQDIYVNGGNVNITTFTINKEGMIYAGDSQGTLTMLDPRAPEAASVYELHERKIAHLNHHPNMPLLASGSNDRTCAVHDTRKLSAKHRIMQAEHGAAVTCASFSPVDGRYLMTSSYDNYVRIFDSSTDYETPLKIHHNNQTGRWVTAFRPVWLHNAAGFAIGNMGRMIDTYIFGSNTSNAKLEMPILRQLSSEHATSIPAVLAVHPRMTHIAGAQASGYIFLFTSSDS